MDGSPSEHENFKLLRLEALVGVAKTHFVTCRHFECPKERFLLKYFNIQPTHTYITAKYSKLPLFLTLCCFNFLKHFRSFLQCAAVFFTSLQDPFIIFAALREDAGSCCCHFYRIDRRQTMTHQNPRRSRKTGEHWPQLRARVCVQKQKKMFTFIT